MSRFINSERTPIPPSPQGDGPLGECLWRPKYGKRTLTAGDDGVVRSTIYSGLWLDPGVLVRKDSETLIAVLLRGVETPEHAAFKTELQRGRIGTKG